jgi:hypothetical protein
MKATSKGGDFETPPAGAHAARLVAIVDLGTQDEEYAGRAYQARKAFFVWALVDERDKGGKQHLIAREYSIESFGPKSGLRQMVEKVRGRKFQEDEDFDPIKMLGQPFLCTVAIKEREGKSAVAKLEDVGPVPKAMGKVSSADYDPFSWEYDPANFAALENCDWLPYCYGQPLIDKVKTCREYRNGGGAVGAGAGGGGAAEVIDDDSPF